MPLKGEVGGHALKSHGNYINDHGKSWKNHGIVFLKFCENPELILFIKGITEGLIQQCIYAVWSAPLLFAYNKVRFSRPYIIWAAREKTCLRGFANNTGADQPAHPCSLISTFVIRFLERIIFKLATGEISIF